MKANRLVVLLLLAGVAGCNQKPPPPAATESPAPVATIQDIMKSVVDTSSAGVWKVPASISDPEKAKPTPAQLDADWAALRKYAVTLAEAPNLLVMEGRVASRPGTKLQDEGLQGNLPAAEIAKRLQTERPKFLALAKGLQTAALGSLAAIDARNPMMLEDAGGKIDEACEACHKAFWYPDAPAPPGAAPAPAAKP